MKHNTEPLKPSQVADKAGISTTRLYQLMSDGKGPLHKRNADKHIEIQPADAARWLKKFGKDRAVSIPQHTEKRNVNGQGTPPEVDDATFAYALGYIESWLGTYAASAGVSQSALASRVGKILHSKAGR